jgi:hypothetical protein
MYRWLSTPSLRQFYLHSSYFFILIVLLVSCTGYQYVSSPTYVPQHHQSGEFRGNLYPNGVQLGYTPINHLLVFATGHLHADPGGKRGLFEKKDVDRFRQTKATEFTLGAGYFIRRQRIIYEVLAGMGGGRIDYKNNRPDFYDYSNRLQAHTKHFYVQPDFGFWIRDHFTFAFFAKLDVCRYSHLSNDTQLGAYAEPEFADQEFMRRTKVNLVTLSPGFSFQGGWQWVKFHVQASPNFKLRTNEVRQQPLNFNVGLSFFLSGKK